MSSSDLETFLEWPNGFHLPQCYHVHTVLPSSSLVQLANATIKPDVPRVGSFFINRRERNTATIKRYAKEYVFKDEFSALQVYRELILLKKLKHENVVLLIDLFASPQGDLYLVTQQEDTELARLLTPRWNWDPAHVSYIMYGVLRGLKYIHSAGVIHRDITPSNIILDTNLTAKITNFNLARPMEPNGQKTGYVTTRYYRAPEVLFTWQAYSTALDMWSAGCILGEILNCIQGNVTKTFRDDNGNEFPCYALFPADSHVDHLVSIIKVLGPPPPSVLHTISDATLRMFIESKVKELEGQTSTIWSYFEACGDMHAKSLLNGLLSFDPFVRLSAPTALTHPYFASYHDPQDEPTRTPIDRSFESRPFTLPEWQACFAAEINSDDQENDIADLELRTPVVGGPGPQLEVEPLGDLDGLSDMMSGTGTEDQAAGAAAGLQNLQLDLDSVELDPLWESLMQENDNSVARLGQLEHDREQLMQRIAGATQIDSQTQAALADIEEQIRNLQYQTSLDEMFSGE